MTNFANNIFGKNLKEITAADLTAYFIEARTETDNLEFKSFPATADFEGNLPKILKTVCAFLNGSGGVLVWGAPVGAKPNGAPEEIFMGAITPVNVIKGEDWVVNKISSSISPMPKDINVHIIHEAGGALYLIEVQNSDYKPHQFNHIYYIRLDGQSKPAPHYMVQALMREIKFPDIRAVIGFSPGQVHLNQNLFTIRIGLFNFSPYQNEFDVNYSIMLVGGIFFNAHNHPNSIISYHMNGALLRHKPFQQPLYYGMPNTNSFVVAATPGLNELNIILSFGGRQSPAKSCSYKLNMANFDLLNPANSLIEYEENIPFQEKQTIDETLAFYKANNI